MLPYSVNMNCTQQTDSFITGERGGKGEAAWWKMERTKRNVQKTERGSEEKEEEERWEE